MPLRDYIDVSALILLVVANTAPVVVTHLLGRRFDAPVDAGRCLRDGKPIFGSHKTWRGVLADVVATGFVGAVLLAGFPAGAAFGALAMLGDLVSSFLKRRFALRSGHRAVLLDQLPEALLPLLVLAPVLGITTREIIGTTLTFVVLDVITERLRPSEQSPQKSRDAHRAR